MQINKQHLPWAMATGRALLGPVLIAGEACNWSGLALAWLVVTALLSDIFDGILARRWRCDTPAVRLFDSMADTFFYLCVAVALWIGQPHLFRANAGLLAALLSLEALRFGLDFAKFGKPSSYHSWLAKSWGLVMAAAVIAAFASPPASLLVPASLALGIACDLEGLVMSLLLPVWRKDVKSLRAALILRQQILVPTVGRTTRSGIPATKWPGGRTARSGIPATKWPGGRTTRSGIPATKWPNGRTTRSSNRACERPHHAQWARPAGRSLYRTEYPIIGL